jgi:hypothetical protein
LDAAFAADIDWLLADNQLDRVTVVTQRRLRNGTDFLLRDRLLIDGE